MKRSPKPCFVAWPANTPAGDAKRAIRPPSEGPDPQLAAHVIQHNLHASLRVKPLQRAKELRAGTSGQAYGLPVAKAPIEHPRSARPWRRRPSAYKSLGLIEIPSTRVRSRFAISCRLTPSPKSTLPIARRPAKQKGLAENQTACNSQLGQLTRPWIRVGVRVWQMLQPRFWPVETPKRKVGKSASSTLERF
jgi:hypothetical protein